MVALAKLKTYAVVGLGSLAAVALLSKSIFYAGFRLPSGSMFPTLELGDLVWVATRAYGFGEQRLPRRGEVVVFELPERAGGQVAPFIKRVAALPGDTLEVHGGFLSINGWKVPTCELGHANVALAEDEARDYHVFMEFLDGQSYLVALDPSRRAEHQGPYHVAVGEFWVLGDNRDNSSDSRSWEGGRGLGVPVDKLMAKAARVVLPTERLGLDVHGPPTLPGSLSALRTAFERCAKLSPPSTPPAPK